MKAAGMIYVLLSVCMLCGCTGSGKKQTVKEDGKVSVRTIEIESRADAHVRTYVGQTRAARGVTLTVPYPGTLEKLTVRAGDYVSGGAVVAQIVSESVRSSYEMAQATLKQAEDAYARASSVYDKGGMPEVKFVDISTSLAKARAGASAAEKALEDCVIKAPFSGTVSEVWLQQGTQVVLAEPVARIIDRNSIGIYIPVPESEFSKVHEGMPAEIDIPALGLYGLAAEVDTKGVEASVVSHTYECSLKLKKPVAGFYPGMMCKVRLDADVMEGIVIPPSLVQTDQTGHYVWIVEDGTVHKAYVGLGGFSGNGVIVRSGLSEGARVICEGYRKVSSGMKVNVIE